MDNALALVTVPPLKESSFDDVTRRNETCIHVPNVSIAIDGSVTTRLNNTRHHDVSAPKRNSGKRCKNNNNKTLRLPVEKNTSKRNTSYYNPSLSLPLADQPMTSSLGDHQMTSPLEDPKQTLVKRESNPAKCFKNHRHHFRR